MRRSIPVFKIGLLIFLVEKTGVITYVKGLILKNKKGIKIEINENLPFELYSKDLGAGTSKLKINIPKNVGKIIKFASEYKLISRLFNNITTKNVTSDQSDQMDSKLVGDILKEVERIRKNKS